MKSIPEEPFSPAVNRQKTIYLNGVSGRKPIVPLDLHELEKAAREVMPEKGYAYMAGGAGTESTIQSNRDGFGKWKIIPRMLRDVSHRDYSATIQGKKQRAPLLLAPIGVLDLARKKGDLMTARAAAACNIPMIFSNQASYSMEDMSAQMRNGLRWFQLYWSKSNELVKSLVQRAERCGCEGIVLTLDTTMLGWRIRDLDLAYLPFLEGKGIGQYTSDPVFKELMNQPVPPDPHAPKGQLSLQTISTLFKLAQNYPGSFFKNLTSPEPRKAVQTFIRTYSRPNLNFEDLEFLRSITSLPIFLKGILHPEDAVKAIQYDINGIIVSNHGGRQVDGAISAIEALPSIVSAVQGKLPVWMDSGIRSGSDVFKALALGAQAVLLGRTYTYGLALAGQAGVEAIIENLLADFELTMGLAGCRKLSEITRDCLTETSGKV